MGRAIRQYLDDLFAGDVIALGLTIFFLFLLAIVAVIWLIDRANKKDVKRKPKPKK